MLDNLMTKASLSYIRRPYLKNKAKQRNKQTKIMLHQLQKQTLRRTDSSILIQNFKNTWKVDSKEKLLLRKLTQKWETFKIPNLIMIKSQMLETQDPQMSQYISHSSYGFSNCAVLRCDQKTQMSRADIFRSLWYQFTSHYPPISLSEGVHRSCCIIFLYLDVSEDITEHAPGKNELEKAVQGDLVLEVMVILGIAQISSFLFMPLSTQLLIFFRQVIISEYF